VNPTVVSTKAEERESDLKAAEQRLRAALALGRRPKVARIARARLGGVVTRALQNAAPDTLP
jgi:hypothetical protein